MDSKRNAENYCNLTAYAALAKIEQEAKQNRAYRPLIYVCSPRSGDIAANQENARRYCRSVVERGGIPLAPNLLLPQFMDEETERELSLLMGITLMGKCDEIWVFGNRITAGMRGEIDRVERLKKKIRRFSEELEEEQEDEWMET